VKFFSTPHRGPNLPCPPLATPMRGACLREQLLLVCRANCSSNMSTTRQSSSTAETVRQQTNHRRRRLKSMTTTTDRRRRHGISIASSALQTHTATPTFLPYLVNVHLFMTRSVDALLFYAFCCSLTGTPFSVTVMRLSFVY